MYKRVTINNLICFTHSVLRKAVGDDDINVDLVASAYDEIKFPLTKVYKICKEDFYLQSAWNMHKGGCFSEKSKNSKSDIGFSKIETNQGNFRLISLLLVISKAFERIIYNRIFNHCTMNNLLFLKKLGFGETIQHITLFWIR